MPPFSGAKLQRVVPAERARALRYACMRSIKLITPCHSRLLQQRRTRCHHFLAPNCSAWCPRSAPAHFAMHAVASPIDHPPATDRLIQQRRIRCHHFLAPNCSAWCPRSAPAHLAMHARTSRKPNQADHPSCRRSLNPAAQDTVPQFSGAKLQRVVPCGARPRTSLCKQLPDASSIKLITPLPQIA